MSRITSTDVARLAGVSAATVSLALNDNRSVAIPEATRERVRKAAKELNYRPNRLARSLVRGRTQTIGVIVGRLDSSFSGRIIQGIEEVCLTADYRVLVAHTLSQSDLESRQIDLLLDHQVDGIVCVANEPTLRELPRRVKRIQASQTACIVVDDRGLASMVDCVVSDDVESARMAVEHLLRLGHRRIAHLSGGLLTSSATDRIAGYKAALAQASVKFDRRLVIGGSYSRQVVEDTLNHLLGLRAPPSAIFAANDEVAAEAWLGLKRRGLNVPKDMALIGCADYTMSHYLGLSTIAQDALEMGRRAARRLLTRIEQPDEKPGLTTLPTRLIIRDSCGGKSVPNNNRGRSK